MTQPLTIRTLRLTDDDEGVDRARRAIANANRRAAAVDSVQAHRLFALRVGQALDGGRAAVLTPENRRRLLATAQRLGLRPFDANLAIAVMQDGVRRGEPVGDDALTRVAARVRPNRAVGGGASLVGPILAALAVSLGAILALIAWLTGE